MLDKLERKMKRIYYAIAIGLTTLMLATEFFMNHSA